MSWNSEPICCSVKTPPTQANQGTQSCTRDSLNGWGKSSLLCWRKAQSNLWPDEVSLSPSSQTWPERKQNDWRGGWDLGLHSYQGESGHFVTEVLFFCLMKTAYRQPWCLLRSFSSQRWQITVHTLCLTGNLPERQEANWFEWHKTKTTSLLECALLPRATVPVPH